MTSKKNSPRKHNRNAMDSDFQTDMQKVVGTLTMRAMAAGNDGDFKTAFSNMEVALWLSQNLEKKCLEAVLMNNLGLLHTLEGAWDKAMLDFDCAMVLAMGSCPANTNFLATIKKNIACLFDSKIATPGDPNI